VPKKKIVIKEKKETDINEEEFLKTTIEFYSEILGIYCTKEHQIIGRR
jgi:hypothetical protein